MHCEAVEREKMTDAEKTEALARVPQPYYLLRWIAQLQRYYTPICCTPVCSLRGCGVQVQTSTDMASFAEADFLVEAATENTDLKLKLFQASKMASSVDVCAVCV